MPIEASFAGSTCTRIAGVCWPPTSTSPTPATCDICSATRFSAYASTSVIGAWSDCIERIRIGASDGLNSRNVGGFGIAFGNEPSAALIASSTSVSSDLRLVLRSNCKVIWVLPSTLVEVICARPGSISPNCVSSGVATVDAMVSGLAPG